MLRYIYILQNVKPTVTVSFTLPIDNAMCVPGFRSRTEMLMPARFCWSRRRNMNRINMGGCLMLLGLWDPMLDLWKRHTHIWRKIMEVMGSPRANLFCPEELRNWFYDNLRSFAVKQAVDQNKPNHNWLQVARLSRVLPVVLEHILQWRQVVNSYKSTCVLVTI